MKTLEAAFETDFNKIDFLERKVTITNSKTFIYGPPRSGKSYLIYDFLSNFKNDEYLYIDLNDPRNDLEEIKQNLFEFIKINQINIIAIENYNFEFEIPNCNTIIISSNKKLEIEDFSTLFVPPLDFEEYLLHDKKHQNITNSFNYFLKYGNLPELIQIDENKKTSRLQEIVRLYTNNDTEYEILQILFKSLGEKKSIYQLFTLLKKKIKISKDKFYALCEFYKQNRTIYFLNKYNQPHAISKLYAYNHTFLDALSHQKNFVNEFTNMLFLELIRHYEEIYYLDGIDFYIPKANAFYLAIAFFNPFLISSLSQKLLPKVQEYGIKRVTIITVANEQSFFLEDLEVEVLPFYEWALGE